jgi:hypothetical protein
MLQLNTIVQDVVAGLQGTVVNAILAFINALLGSILPGIFPGS